jgi:maleate isomerase
VITVGVVTPHAVAGADVELRDMAGDLVHTRVARIVSPRAGEAEPPTSVSGLRALTRPALLDKAVAELQPESLDVLAFASTSTAYAIGPAAERRLVGRLRERWSLPVCSTPASTVDALRYFGVQRLSLVHPPWFGAGRSALGAEYFREQGFTVVQAQLADVLDDPELVEPHHVVEWVASHVDPTVEAVFLGGNGFRAARAIRALEERLGRLILESNQVLLWWAMAETGACVQVRDSGSLLHTLSSSAPTAAAVR